jgi:hypothetical protein
VRTIKPKTNSDVITNASGNIQCLSLTIKELKSYSSFENIDDKEAEEIIQSYIS